MNGLLKNDVTLEFDVQAEKISQLEIDLKAAEIAKLEVESQKALLKGHCTKKIEALEAENSKQKLEIENLTEQIKNMSHVT